MVHRFVAEDGSDNFIFVSSQCISLAAQYAIDSSGTVKAEVGDEPDSRGKLKFIRFVEGQPLTPSRMGKRKEQCRAHCYQGDRLLAAGCADLLP